MYDLKDFYTSEILKETWCVPKRYTNLNHIGAGTYGSVCSSDDVLFDPPRPVAIKKACRPFQTIVHAKRAYREFKLLRQMNHENVIELYDCFTADSSFRAIKDFYMVTELMDYDLRKVLREYGQLAEEQVRFVVYEMLRGLKYIHSCGVIHRDLKPANIGIRTNPETVKILDFGLARAADSESMTGYVATRWYRAPEIMLNWMHYKQNMDVWSVGCIMAEMIKGKALFPGKTQIDQLMVTLDLLGTPSEEFLNSVESIEARKYLKSLPKKEGKDFQEVFANVSVEAAELMEKMLVLDPTKRYSVEDALSHPFLSKYHVPLDEPSASSPISDDMDLQLSTMEWRELIWNEIIDFQKSSNPEPMVLS